MYIRSVVSPLSVGPPAMAAAGPAHAQQMPDVGEQIARMSGALRVMARECGEASDAELVEAKRWQKANHGSFGMDPTTFDRGFDAGETEAEGKWKTLPPAQQQENCR